MNDDEYPRRSRGKKGGGGILYLVLLVAVAGGIWYFWNSGFDIGKATRAISGESLSIGIGKLFDQTPGHAQTAKDAGASLVKSGMELLIEKPKEAVTGFANEMTKAGIEVARKELGQVLGVPIGTLGEQSSVSIVRPVQQNLSLLIGADVEDLLYSVNWGDKQAISGSVKKGESKSIEHFWKELGDYSILVEITGTATGKKSYTFPVTIQK